MHLQAINLLKLRYKQISNQIGEHFNRIHIFSQDRLILNALKDENYIIMTRKNVETLRHLLKDT